jgi:hypothetical protein
MDVVFVFVAQFDMHAQLFGHPVHRQKEDYQCYDVKRDVRTDRARMTINWLRPFLALTPIDYKILCKKCVAKVDGVWKKQTMFFNAVASKVSLISNKQIKCDY